MLLHHQGFVVKSIEDYEKNLIFEEKLKEVIDPVQQAKLTLYSNFGSSNIELIEPIEETAFTYNFLQKSGGGFHHNCYEVSDESEMRAFTESRRMIQIKGPLEALLFDGLFVFFFMDYNRQIVEFLIDPKT